MNISRPFRKIKSLKLSWREEKLNSNFFLLNLQDIVGYQLCTFGEIANHWNCPLLYGAPKDSVWPKMWSKEIKSMAFSWLVKLCLQTVPIFWDNFLNTISNCPPGHSHIARLTSWKPHLPNFANWAPRQLPNYRKFLCTTSSQVWQNRESESCLKVELLWNVWKTSVI